MQRAVELRGQEKELHLKLPTHLRPLLKEKKLLLWQDILLDLEYPDAKIIDEICHGFPVTGWAQQSNVF